MNDTVKKSLKPIFVTLAIILTCGALLAICSDLLYVDGTERIQRAIDSIYSEGGIALADGGAIIDEYSKDAQDAVEIEKDGQVIGIVKSCYLLNNGDYLVHVTGKKGYSNGTVTLYVSVVKSDSGVHVKKVSDKVDYSGQTLMSKLAGYYDKFTDNQASDVFKENGQPSTVVSGATYSSTAVSNGVYAALQFVSEIGD